jgi:hypothetical protein
MFWEVLELLNNWRTLKRAHLHAVSYEVMKFVSHDKIL